MRTFAAGFRYACRNLYCNRYGQHRDGRGPCPGCGWITELAAIITTRIPG